MEKEILEEVLAQKMIIMEISSIWEKDFQKLSDFYHNILKNLLIFFLLLNQ